MMLSRSIQTFMRVSAQDEGPDGEFHFFQKIRRLKKKKREKKEKKNTYNLHSLINGLLENVDFMDNLFSKTPLKMFLM